MPAPSTATRPACPLKRTEVSGGLAIVKAKDDISQAHSTAQGSNKGDSVPLAAVPFGYFSTPINEDFTFGLGIYVPYGIINDYENGFMGSSHGSYSKVQVITVQPTIAWKINDKVSVGFGPTFNRIDGQLKNTLAAMACSAATAIPRSTSRATTLPSATTSA